MKLRKNEEAVSPVIGVILMVAITVILAAVIAAFVFGMGTPKAAPQASIQITGATTLTQNISLTHSGGDSIDLSKTRAIIDGVNTSQHNVINQLSANVDFFAAGDSLIISPCGTGGTPCISKVLHNNVGATTGTTTGNFTLVTGTVTVTLIDIASSQQVAKITATVAS